METKGKPTIMNIKRLILSGLVGAAIIGGGVEAQANPIINNHNNRTETWAQNFWEHNQPRNGGTTTLLQKCEAIHHFTWNDHSWGSIGKSMELGFQAGYEHELPNGDVHKACDIARRMNGGRF